MSTLGPVVTCAADGCHSRARATADLDERGQVLPQPPLGWGEVAAITEGGTELRLFVCSRSCERRLAAGLALPRLGSL